MKAMTSVTALALVCALGVTGTARSEALVIDGEEIADAETYASAQQEGRVVHYGTYPTGLAERIHQAFTEATGIAVEYVRAPTGALQPRIAAEASAGQLGADFVDLTDLPMIADLVESGVLASPHEVPGFDGIDPALRDEEGRWYTYIRPSYIIAVNTAVIGDAPVPDSWAGLLDPALGDGMIGLPSIDAGGSAFSAYMFMTEVMGEDYLAQLAAQAPRIYPSVAPTVNELVRGETAVAMVDAGLIASQIAEGAPVEAIFPSEGTPGFPAAGGITASAQNRNAAIVYLNWLTSKAGSDAVAATGAYGIHPDADLPVAGELAFPPNDQIWNIDLDSWIEQQESFVQEWHSTFGSN